MGRERYGALPARRAAARRYAVLLGIAEVGDQLDCAATHSQQAPSLIDLELDRSISQFTAQLEQPSVVRQMLRIAVVWVEL
jgi:hypothetical protein